MSDYPYADRFAINRSLPERGTSREDVLAELRAMASEEDAFWETGKCSGTMYCGDHDHYHFMNEAFGLFAHVNVLQRDMCPSATKFEAEIIAMTLGLQSGDAASAADDEPCGLVTTGGTGSILHAILAYREHGAAERGITRPNVIKPETAHPAFDKACHLFGVELRRAPGRPRHHPGRRGLGARPHGRPDGGADRVRLQLRLRHRRRDRRPVRPRARARGRSPRRCAAWAGSSCPSAASWATTSPPSTTPCPA